MTQTVQCLKGFRYVPMLLQWLKLMGDLSVFLKSIQKGCKPNLSTNATQGLPCGSGRKGGVPKRKRKSATPIESCSVRQYFQWPPGGDILPHFTVDTQSDLALTTYLCLLFLCYFTHGY